MYKPWVTWIQSLSIAGAILAATDPTMAQDTSWRPAGWGGGGYYWSAVFHPTQENTIYMAGDISGVYKTTDLGEHWHLSDIGIGSYEVYGLAIDAKNPEILFADTTTGLNRSTDGAEHWQPLPGAAALGIKGKRNVTIHPVAIDPSNGKIIYAGTADGKICKSTDGGDTWAQVYEASGAIHSVVVSPGDANTVIAATSKSGLVMSSDAGKTWAPLQTPADASSLAFAVNHPKTIYAAFLKDGIYKSTDSGKTWAALPVKGTMVDVVINPANANDVYCISSADWNGRFFASHDGGSTWVSQGSLTFDRDADPTGPVAGTQGPMSTLTNLTISPVNPKLLFISANWRPALSKDAGATWVESDRGADISCIADIRFHGKKTFVGVMDEGVLSSDDDGAHWSQLWPLKFDDKLSGHYWRLAIWDQGQSERILSTSTPWNGNLPNHVVISDDGGKTFSSSSSGLPDYNTHANTMWGRGYMRALAPDPNDPKIIYAGIDGDPANGNQGGGVFKSADGGITWAQLPAQPGSRRMFYGLVVDPTDSQRIYWAACGTGGGLYRSDDGGGSWKQIFDKESFLFNLAVSANGTVYAPGKNLWKSTDHGKTWTQISDFKDGCQIVGLETSPTDENTIWLSSVSWGNSKGFIRKTTDGGGSWTDITGNIPYQEPLVLRYNQETRELWAGGAGLWRLSQ